MVTPLLQINNWKLIFEDSKSLLKRQRSNCIVPNKQSGSGYKYLIDQENGEALYGAFHALILLLSKQPCDNRDGYLTVDGTKVGVRYDAKYIANKTLFKPETITSMLNEITKKLGWATNHTNPENIVPAVYPSKAPDKIFLEMANEYHHAVAKTRVFDPKFNQNIRQTLDIKGAIVLDTLHNEMGWKIDQIEALLEWMPTDVFWSRMGADLGSMLKSNQGRIKAVSAMDVMQMRGNKGLLTSDQMLTMMNRENLGTDDFKEINKGEETFWVKK